MRVDCSTTHTDNCPCSELSVYCWRESSSSSLDLSSKDGYFFGTSTMNVWWCHLLECCSSAPSQMDVGSSQRLRGARQETLSYDEQDRIDNSREKALCYIRIQWAEIKIRQHRILEKKNLETARLRQREGELMNMKPPLPPPPPKWKNHHDPVKRRDKRLRW